MTPNLPSWSDELIAEAVDVVRHSDDAGRCELASVVFGPLGRELERRARGENEGMPIESAPIRLDPVSPLVLGRILPLMSVVLRYREHSRPVLEYLEFVDACLTVQACEHIG